MKIQFRLSLNPIRFRVISTLFTLILIHIQPSFANSICSSGPTKNNSGHFQVFLNHFCNELKDENRVTKLHREILEKNSTDVVLFDIYQSFSDLAKPSQKAIKADEVGKVCEALSLSRHRYIKEVPSCKTLSNVSKEESKNELSQQQILSIQSELTQIVEKTRRELAQLEYKRFLFKIEELAKQDQIEILELTSCENTNNNQDILSGRLKDNELSSTSDAYLVAPEMPCIRFKTKKTIQKFIVQAKDKEQKYLGNWYIPPPIHLSELLPLNRLKDRLSVGQKAIDHLVDADVPPQVQLFFGPIKPIPIEEAFKVGDKLYYGFGGNVQIQRIVVNPERFPTLYSLGGIRKSKSAAPQVGIEKELKTYGQVLTLKGLKRSIQSEKDPSKLEKLTKDVNQIETELAAEGIADFNSVLNGALKESQEIFSFGLGKLGESSLITFLDQLWDIKAKHGAESNSKILHFLKGDGGKLLKNVFQEMQELDRKLGIYSSNVNRTKQMISSAQQRKLDHKSLQKTLQKEQLEFDLLEDQKHHVICDLWTINDVAGNLEKNVDVIVRIQDYIKKRDEARQNHN